MARLALILLVCTVSIVPLLPTLESGYLDYDDPAAVRDNPLAHDLSWETVKGTARLGPFGLRLLSYAVDAELFGPTARSYHLGNLILYALLVLLVVLVLERLGGSLFGALAGGVLFGLHPLHVEPVAWLACRKDLLMGVAFFGATLSWLYWQRHGGRLPYLVALGLYPLAILAKPHAVVLPICLWILGWCGFRTPPADSRRGLRPLIPFFALAGVGALGTVWIAGVQHAGIQDPHGGTLLSHVLTAGHGALLHHVKLLFPVRLSILYGLPPGQAADPLSWLYLVGGLLPLPLAVWAWRRGYRLWAGVLAWHLVVLLPVSNLVPISLVAADRYLLLSTFAPALLAARWIAGAGRGRVKTALILSVASLLAVLTVDRVADWRNEHLLWQGVVRAYPSVDVGHYHLANARFREGLRHYGPERTEKLQLARAGFKRTLQIRPDHPAAWYNLGTTLRMLGEMGPAQAALEQALALRPRYPAARRQLVLVLLAQDAWLAAIHEAKGELRRVGAEGVLRAFGKGVLQPEIPPGPGS